MGVDVRNIRRVQAGIAQSHFHAAGCSFAKRRGSCHVVGIGGVPISDQLAIDGCAALPGVFELFEHQNPGAAERARAGLLNAVERLEKRIHELEHTAQPPLNEPKSDPLAPAGETKSEATSNELKTDSAPSELNTDSSASEFKTDSSNGDHDLPSFSPEPQPITSEAKTDSPANDFAKSPAPNDIPTNGPTHTHSENGAPTPPVTAVETGRITGLIGKGQSLLNVDKAEEALACFDEVLTLDAQNAEALVKKGTALERLRKLEEAIECYNRAIVADGSMTIAYLYKGGLFNRLERFTEAMECYEQALRTQEKRRG